MKQIFFSEASASQESKQDYGCLPAAADRKPPDGQQAFVDRVLGLFTVVLAQPGIFATAKIASNSRLELRKRVFWAIAVFGVFACAIPMWISSWLSPLFAVPH